MHPAPRAQQGFTLIELSIVLVIIGLIVGGVLVGQDLIRAAAVRAQISQIEKYNTAVNTFYGKFGALPGDIPAALVTEFGFTATPVRAGTKGHGDGNGELDGFGPGGVDPYSWGESGETFFFWEDLSANSSLIDGTFNSAVDGVDTNCSTLAACSVYMPPAKVGSSNSIYVYSGYAEGCCAAVTGIGPNFFGLSVISSIGGDNVDYGGTPSAPGLTVAQAFSIDKKMDDGMPTTGNVLAQYLGGGGGTPSWSPNAASPSSSTCFDTTSHQYSVAQNNGNGVNCALSFQFQ